MPDWDWRWHAEIEKFPSAVLAERHPTSVNLGDVNAEDFIARAEKAGRPDVLVFGSPCQDFSVAGRRVGLDGDRGNLALVALGIVNRLRPRWVVFENVPGLLSSYSGSAEAERQVREGPVGGRADGDEDSDFAAFLALVQQCGYLGCYRITDAQYAGVPQRRRRIFAVFHPGDWRPAAAVLFEPDSLRGDNPPSCETRERVAGSIRASAARRGGIQGEAESDGLIAADVAPTISARPSGGGGLGTDFDLDGGLTAIQRPLNPDGPVGSVSSKWSKGTGGPAGDECYNLVADVIAFSERTRGDDGRGYEREPAFRTDSYPTIDTVKPPAVIAFDTTQITHPANRSRTDDRSPQLSQSGHAPAVAFNWQGGGDQTSLGFDPDSGLTGSLTSGQTPAIAFQPRVARNGQGDASDVVPALNGADAGATSDMRPCVVFKPSHYTRGKDGAPSDIVPPLGAEPDKGDQDPVMMTGTVVRRLTPRECERLQAFPDDYTLIRYRGAPAADGPRYKALGNAMNVNEIGWILRRIELFEATVGSKRC